ncbi:alpha/beta fold hydrolase [Microvirga sp. VF16]|uniref:alpha/beta fold hydrolase n=1 Tax=Microvirga sp. VF16 TaxID=2807101 RepID=UPI00193DBE1F|nr:alpha/beta hydrolase [Microvirga sp. VF16]QRM33737.1 alpha/beta hydrolase [Microvirga sp. VF16]QRM36078.1 alpha/beta hydrolase [Microvirga sp. VF16]
MLKRSLFAIFGFVLGSSAAWSCTDISAAKEQAMDIGYIDVTSDITLRRMRAGPPSPKGTVLLLHGFPETLCAWKEISRDLSADYEVHAIDWPGYGLSSRPAADRFSYSPKDYAGVLGEYIKKAGIDTSKLTIYATDIGALPALLLALDDPKVARTIIVGDFAPFNRPQYMHDRLQGLKSEPSATAILATYKTRTGGEILDTAVRGGLSKEAQFDVSADFKEDVSRGWSHGGMTPPEAFYHYYANFTRDEDFLEANLHKLKTPVRIVWGEKDVYITKEMGIEFANRVNADITLLPGIGHYPHLQSPKQTVEEIRASFR